MNLEHNAEAKQAILQDKFMISQQLESLRVRIEKNQRRTQTIVEEVAPPSGSASSAAAPTPLQVRIQEIPEALRKPPQEFTQGKQDAAAASQDSSHPTTEAGKAIVGKLADIISPAAQDVPINDPWSNLVGDPPLTPQEESK